VASDVTLSCMYINARSNCNKMDNLLTLVEVYKPHIIAITESLCCDIFDSELSIPDYDLFRIDTPLDNKGGVSMSVMLYVSSYLGAVEWSPVTQFPEQVWCRLNINSHNDLLIGVCYNSRNGTLFPKNGHTAGQ